MSTAHVQLSFTYVAPRKTRFDGVYDEEKNQKRMTHQLDMVLDFMLDSQWCTVPEIVQGLTTHNMAEGKCTQCNTTDRTQPCLLVRATETGISARLRDLRKPKFGGYTVEIRRRSDGGLWEYRLVVPATAHQIGARSGA
jgi:hypothetical protein